MSKERQITAILFTILCCAFTKVQSGNRMALDSVLCLGLPVVEVATIDSIEPTGEYVDAPEGFFGRTVLNAMNVPGRLRVWRPDGILLYDSKEEGMAIKLRGNWSATRKLKPYKVKLQRKADLLNRGNDAKYKDKNWLLLKDCRNTQWGSTLNDIVGLQVSRMVGLPWTPAYANVNLLFNGEYRGLYLLVESIDRNPHCRIDVNKQEGFVVERDLYWWKTPCYFDTLLSDSLLRFTFTYPDEDDVTADQIDYIKDAVMKMEESIVRGDYDKYLDVHSLAAWVLGHDILGTSDGGGANFFLTKYDHSPQSKLLASTLWDFDTNYNTEGRWSMLHTSPLFYFERLFSSPNPAFAAEYVRQWQALSPIFLDAMQSWLNNLASSPTGVAMDASRVVQDKLWNFRNVTVREDVEEAMSWFTTRKVWLDEQMMEIDTVDRRNGIGLPNVTPRNSSHVYYDLSGRRLSARPTKGLYIEDGKVKVGVKDEE